ncbi:MAG TPA: helix-turn-helix domain-containing protein [Sedimentisphaerales bacterium]|nr:helix-turn-helix domain-containing protein [Sedimentisphaerales bacterium]
MTKGNNVLTTGDVANICNVAPRTVSQWFDKGLLTGYRIPGSRDRRIPIAELAQFMAAHRIPIPKTWPVLKNAVPAPERPKTRRRPSRR